MAVRAGATQIQGTINGYGERNGNADLCVIIPNLTLKLGREVISAEQLATLTQVSRYVQELANQSPDPRQPYVGASAFAHKGGIHVSAILKHPQTYEHIAPELVGNKRRVLVSELAGISNIIYKAREFNLQLERSSPVTGRIVSQIKELEHKGYQFEGADGSFELLVRKELSQIPPLFVLEGFRLVTEKKEDNGPAISEATIKLRVGDSRVHTASEGDGPVNALDNALRKALETFYPQLKSIKLSDYKVRVLDEKSGTAAKVRVLIQTKDEKRSWGTVGVSTDIIEASWRALVDSLEYGILFAADEPQQG
jgi:2-isopropylmalate synthase